MIVIGIASPKGGAGKTTIAIALASVYCQKYKVCLLDADPKQRAYEWADNTEKLEDAVMPENLKVLGHPGKADEVLSRIAEERGKDTEIMIIDVEGSENMTMAYSIAASNVVVIPSKDSFQDAEDVISTVKIIQSQEQIANRKIKHLVVFNEVDAHIVTKDIKEIASDLDSLKIPYAKTRLVRRRAHRAPHYYGGILHDLPTKDVSGVDAAIRDAQELADEILMEFSDGKA